MSDSESTPQAPPPPPLEVDTNPSPPPLPPATDVAADESNHSPPDDANQATASQATADAPDDEPLHALIGAGDTDGDDDGDGDGDGDGSATPTVSASPRRANARANARTASRRRRSEQQRSGGASTPTAGASKTTTASASASTSRRGRRTTIGGFGGGRAPPSPRRSTSSRRRRKSMGPGTLGNAGAAPPPSAAQGTRSRSRSRSRSNPRAAPRRVAGDNNANNPETPSQVPVPSSSARGKDGGGGGGGATTPRHRTPQHPVSRAARLRHSTGSMRTPRDASSSNKSALRRSPPTGGGALGAASPAGSAMASPAVVTPLRQPVAPNEPGNVRVVCRFRPLSKSETARGDKMAVLFPESKDSDVRVVALRWFVPFLFVFFVRREAVLFSHAADGPGFRSARQC